MTEATGAEGQQALGVDGMVAALAAVVTIAKPRAARREQLQNQILMLRQARLGCQFWREPCLISSTGNDVTWLSLSYRW